MKIEDIRHSNLSDEIENGYHNDSDVKFYIKILIASLVIGVIVIVLDKLI